MGLQCRSFDCSSQFATRLRDSLEAEGFAVRHGRFAAAKEISCNVLVAKRDEATVTILVDRDGGNSPEPADPDKAARLSSMMAERGITPWKPDPDFPVRLDVVYTDTLLDVLRRKVDRDYLSRSARLALDVERVLLRNGQQEIKPFP